MIAYIEPGSIQLLLTFLASALLASMTMIRTLRDFLLRPFRKRGEDPEDPPPPRNGGPTPS